MVNKLSVERLNEHRIKVDGYEMACYVDDIPTEVADDMRRKLAVLEDINGRREVDPKKIAAYRFASEYILTDEGKYLVFG